MPDPERPPLLSAPPHDRIRTLEELVGLANAIEVEAVARYAMLTRVMDRRGDHDTAETFREMCAIEQRHVEEVGRWASSLRQRIPPPEGFLWRLPPEIGASWEEVQNSALLTSYRALAIAVVNEERAFALYSYIAAHAADPEVQRQAEVMAREELAHATELRIRRRRAYHREHPGGPRRPEAEIRSAADLRDLDRRLREEAASVHRRVADQLDAIGDSTSAALVRAIADDKAALDPAGAAAAAHTPEESERSLALLRAALSPLERASEIYEDVVAHAEEEELLRAGQERLESLVGRISLLGRRISEIEGQL